MTLTNFDINEDHIGLYFEGKYLDLHNNFEFQRFNYSVANHELELEWVKSKEEWVPHEIFERLKLVFKKVNFLRIKERDHELPWTEDSTLEMIGFFTTNK